MVRWALLLASFLSAAVLAAPARAEIRIGVATPLTGPVAWAGGSNLTGAEIAVADVNAQGGVRGERIELIVADDFSEWRRAGADAARPSGGAKPARALDLRRG